MSEMNGSGDAKVAAAGGNGGQGGKINVNFNPEMVPGRSRVTAVYRTRATKGGRDGSGVIRFEGDPRDLREVMPDPAFLDMGAAERAELVGEAPWWRSLVYLLVVLAAVFGLTVLLMKGCGSDNPSTVPPGTTTTITTTAFVPAQPAAPPAPQVIAVQVKDGKDGRDGRDGTTGPMGPQGPQGEKGDLGDVGPAGRTGIDGIDGVDGKDGKNGRSGRDGAHGSAGPQGPAGQDGVSAGPVTIKVIGGQYELEDEDEE